MIEHKFLKNYLNIRNLQGVNLYERIRLDNLNLLKGEWGMKRNKIFIVISILLIILTSCNPSEKRVIGLEEMETRDLLNIDDLISSEIMQTEFEYLVNKILEVHPDPKINIGDNWDHLVEEIKNQLNKPMSAGEYAITLMTFTSKLKDAHTLVYPFNIKTKVIPVKFKWVKDGLSIVESNNPHLETGDLVIKMGELTIEEIFQRMSKVISSENEYWVKEQGKNFLKMELFLRSLSVLKNDTVTLTIDRNNEILTLDVDLINDEEQEMNDKKESIWYHWEIISNGTIGYFEIIESKYTQLFDRQVFRFFKEIERNNIDKIMIDLRKNVGGNSMVMDPFLKHMPMETIKTYATTVKYSEEAAKQRGYEKTTGTEYYPHDFEENKLREPLYHGKVYILTNSQTFSTANMFATYFHDVIGATIIGEATGNKPSCFGDVITLELPLTKFYLGISYKEFFRPDQSLNSENTLMPDVLIEKTRDDLISGKDGQLERMIDFVMKDSK